MKTRSWLLTVVTAISALALLATPAEAGGKKKKYYRHIGICGISFGLRNTIDGQGAREGRPLDDDRAGWIGEGGVGFWSYAASYFSMSS